MTGLLCGAVTALVFLSVPEFPQHSRPGAPDPAAIPFLAHRLGSPAEARDESGWRLLPVQAIDEWASENGRSQQLIKDFTERTIMVGEKWKTV